MGRRSRKRGSGAAPPASDQEAAERPVPRAPDRRARMTEAPKAPWSPFPLNELCVLIALVLMVWGFASQGDRRGTLLIAGVVLVSLAGGELAVREHFSGFRSHSALLAAICALAAVVPLYFLTGVPQEAIAVVAVAIFALAFRQMRRAFAARAGGLAFRA